MSCCISSNENNQIFQMPYTWKLGLLRISTLHMKCLASAWCMNCNVLSRNRALSCVEYWKLHTWLFWFGRILQTQVRHWGNTYWMITALFGDILYISEISHNDTDRINRFFLDVEYATLYYRKALWTSRDWYLGEQKTLWNKIGFHGSWSKTGPKHSISH